MRETYGSNELTVALGSGNATTLEIDGKSFD